MTIQDDNLLIIDEYDSIGYYDTMKTIRIGMVYTSRYGDKYKILNFVKLEITCDGKRIYFDVEKIN